MKLLTGFLLLSVTTLAQSSSPSSIIGTWNGTAVSHGQDVPIHLKLTADGPGLKAAFVNGPEESPASSVKFTGDHLLVTFDYYAKNLDVTLTDTGRAAKFTGSFGTTTVRYPVTLLSPMAMATEGGPLLHDLTGDWEIAVESVKGESAWNLHINQVNPSLYRAVIQRIDGDTGSLYTTSPGFGLFSHFTAYGPALYKIVPQPDGTLLVSNMLHADLKTDRQQDLVARRPAEARKEKLPPPTDTAQQTTVKDPTVPFAFSFPELTGKMVSNTDPRFDGKVVIIAIGGSWCPNCHDEAPFLVGLYNTFHSQGLEIVNLSFEEDEQVKDPTGLRAFIARYKIPYTVLLAGNTDQLNEKIPQGVHLNSWPTTFFLGRDGLVKEVHAGFAGPANPPAHDALVREVTDLVEHLLKEPVPVRSASLRP